MAMEEEGASSAPGVCSCSLVAGHSTLHITLWPASGRSHYFPQLVSHTRTADPPASGSCFLECWHQT